MLRLSRSTATGDEEAQANAMTYQQQLRDDLQFRGGSNGLLLAARCRNGLHDEGRW